LIPDRVVSSSDPVRVLFVTHTAEWIGPNISLLELVIRLPAELEPMIAVPHRGRLTDALLEHSIPFIEFRRFDKYRIPALVRMIRREKFSLVYGNSAHGASRNALIAAKLCRLPFIYHLREMAPSDWTWRHQLDRWADAAIAVSQATAESYRGRFQEPPRVIYNGVSPERFDLDRDVCRREVASEFGIDAARPIVIHVGNVYRRKGQRVAAEVIRELQRVVPGCCLLMVGRLDRDPTYVDSLRAMLSEYSLQDRVFITGLRDDVGRLLAAADLFLHTAVEDPHPRGVIEAMATGLPVVALAVDGVSETVVDGETGFLVSWPCSSQALADPVARLLTSPQMSRAMGDRGRERTRRLFSADRTARDVTDVILGLIRPR
jgi:glycosyltransferase involved in cell wall biosynthesis